MATTPKSDHVRWYPTITQLSDPASVHGAFKQVLDQHYQLLDEHNDLKRRIADMPLPGRSGPPPGSGPTDTMLLGLRVQPIDPTRLANGATVKWDTATRTFIVS